MRKSFKYIILLLLLAAFATACGSDKADEPDSPSGKVDVPPRNQPLLKSYYEGFAQCEMWPSTTIDDSSLTGEGGDYYYWQEHKTEAQTNEELYLMCDIPEEKLSAMSTCNLVRTCFVHPYAPMIYAHDVEYAGAIWMTTANSYREMMRRRSAPQEMLNLYREVQYPAENEIIDKEPGLSYLDYNEKTRRSTFRINAMTLFIMTAVDCNRFDNKQLAAFAAEVFNKVNKIKESSGDEVDYRYVMRYPYLLGAMIAFHYDNALSDDEVELVYKFYGFQGMPGAYENMVFTAEDVSRTTMVISQSLERIMQLK